MQFCKVCENMYYLKITDTDEVMYECKKCGDSIHVDGGIVVSQTHFKKSEQNININQYTKFDPTLPRITFLNCPKVDCENHGDAPDREIIFIRYDSVKLNYIYLCPKCNTVWKSDKN